MWRPVKLVLFALFLASVCLFSEQGLLKLRRLQALEKRLIKETQGLARENTEMTQEIQKLKDPAHLERLIRDTLGYVRPGEILVEIGS